MRELQKLTDIVKEILQEDESTRSSDKYLYYAVCKRLNDTALDDKLGDFLLTFSDYGLPQFESVGRARRKIQAQFPELRPSEDIQRGRYERSVDFQKFAKCEVR